MASGVIMADELSLPVDREKVRVYASFRQGTAVAEALAQAKLQLFLQPAATGPYIAGMTSAYYNEQAGADGAVTRVPVPMEAGGMAVITGNGLKVVGTDPTVGVTLTKADDADTSFFIPASRISPNTPKKLQFILPAGITEGAWRVSVTTQYTTGNKTTREPRTFTLDRLIYVGETAPDTPGGDGGGEEDDDNQSGSPPADNAFVRLRTTPLSETSGPGQPDRSRGHIIRPPLRRKSEPKENGEPDLWYESLNDI